MGDYSTTGNRRRDPRTGGWHSLRKMDCVNVESPGVRRYYVARQAAALNAELLYALKEMLDLARAHDYGEGGPALDELKLKMSELERRAPELVRKARQQPLGPRELLWWERYHCEQCGLPDGGCRCRHGDVVSAKRQHELDHEAGQREPEHE